jgi:hypothetical protein
MLIARVVNSFNSEGPELFHAAMVEIELNHSSIARRPPRLRGGPDYAPTR